MAIKVSQSLRQEQGLAITPQLQQAIKMLTLTHLEMTNVIAEEMVENPMLEEAGAENSEGEEERLEMQNAEANAENFEGEAVFEKKDDFDWQSYIESYNSSSSAPPSVAGRDLSETLNYENIVSREQSLVEHLEWQLRMEDLSDVQYKFALQIIHNINDDGYLEMPFEELLDNTPMNREQALLVWELVKRLDPVGCACESLADCLLAQAQISGRCSPLMEKIICHHLDDIKNKNYSKISTALGVDEKHILKSLELLKSFYPKPGRLIAPSETHYVVPDIYVVEIGGEFMVKVNDDGVPRLRISKMYQQMLQQSTDRQERSYVKSKLNAAMWLIKSIRNRQTTIHKVAEAIVHQQQLFFKKGVHFLKPMLLKDIAREIGVHESTVSRVTTNKYMHTPIGMFELKYFFNAGLGGKSGEVLKLKIKEMIAGENPTRPLSDQRIADILSADEGAKIARRTVAKYREYMGILSSSKRKIRKKT